MEGRCEWLEDMARGMVKTDGLEWMVRMEGCCEWLEDMAREIVRVDWLRGCLELKVVLDG